MSIFNFFKQYIIHPRTTGAIFPSSKELACEMVDEIDFEKSKCIVEFGPGTGVFTAALINKRQESTILILMETNGKFFNVLKKQYKDEKNMFIINDSAENIGKYIELYGLNQVDYIISGLPFASLPDKISNRILNNSKMFLSDNGSFILFQYTLFKKEFIRNYFQIKKVKRVWGNIPPAYVFTCKI